MPTVGLIVEGLYDEAVIPVLVKRCRARVNVVTRKCRGSITGKLAGILAELERSSSSSDFRCRLRTTERDSQGH